MGHLILSFWAVSSLCFVTIPLCYLTMCAHVNKLWYPANVDICHVPEDSHWLIDQTTSPENLWDQHDGSQEPAVWCQSLGAKLSFTHRSSSVSTFIHIGMEVKMLWITLIICHLPCLMLHRHSSLFHFLGCFYQTTVLSHSFCMLVNSFLVNVG